MEESRENMKETPKYAVVRILQLHPVVPLFFLSDPKLLDYE